MTDATTIAPEEIGPRLEAAKTVNGSHFLKIVGELEAAGKAIPFQHRQLAEQMRAALPPDAGGGGTFYIKPADALAAADGLRRAGVDPERVVAALAAHGVKLPDPNAPAGTDPTAFNWQAPVTANPAKGVELDTDLRGLASAIGFAPEMGSKFGSEVIATLREIEAAPDRAMLTDKWRADLLKTFGEAAIVEKSERIVEMLKAVGENALLNNLKATGALRNPKLFVALANRAAAFASRSK